MTAIDFAIRKPLGTLACMQQQGHSGIARYLDGSRVNGKQVTPAELADIKAAGFEQLFLVFETSGGAAISGFRPHYEYFTHAQGGVDAREALAAVSGLGLPLSPERAIYFAVDFDASEPWLLTEYFRGVFEVTTDKVSVGPYGNYDVCIQSRDHWPFARRRWQTYAWSAGRIDPGADIYQFQNGVVLCGARVDINEAGNSGWKLGGGSEVATREELLELIEQEYDLKNTIKAMKETYDPAAAAIPTLVTKGQYAEMTAAAINRALEGIDTRISLATAAERAIVVDAVVEAIVTRLTTHV